MRGRLELDQMVQVWSRRSSTGADTVAAGRGITAQRRRFLWVLTISLWCSVLSSPARARDQPGSMLNIDCGVSTSYLGTANLTWVPDAPYCTTGTSVQGITTSGDLATLRYFPDPRIKTCYVLPATAGSRYFIRGRFYHGGYDGTTQPSGLRFNVSLDATVVSTLDIQNLTTIYAFTIIAQAVKDTIFICLARNSPLSTGHPFISSLQSVTLAPGMYPEAEDASGLRILSAAGRKNYGAVGTGAYQYPADPYARTWRNDGLGNTLESVKTSQTVSFGDAINQPPSIIMQTAKQGEFFNEPFTPLFNASYLNSGSNLFVLYLYFAEIDNTTTIGSRVFDIVVNNVPWMKNFDILASASGALYQSVQLTRSVETLALSISLSLVASANSSKLPPLINGAEAQQLSDPMALRTPDQDVLGVESIKAAFGLNDWTGDPCMPVPYGWITCDSSSPPRVITVQLANMSLVGSIPSGIGNLTSLVTLNLENNNLTGVVPESVLSIPGLTIQVLGNPLLQCPGENKCTFTTSGKKPDAATKSSRTNTAVVVGAAAGGVIVVAIFICLLILCVRKRKRKLTPAPVVRQNELSVQTLAAEDYPATVFEADKNNHRAVMHDSKVPVLEPLEIVTGSLFLTGNPPSGASTNSSRNAQSGSFGGRRSTTSSSGRGSVINSIQQEVRNYSWEEVLDMTHNKDVELGKGGFGPVYYGKLADGREVAVKILSAASQQGIREFQNEVDLLSRVNHGNLVHLYGYCQEPYYVLVYEYAEEGTLRDHLHGGKKAQTRNLDWMIRLNIAMNSACGLEYLHTGCRPSIIHRDIKSCNILLTKNMHAKVADFGLSKLGAEQGDIKKSHVSTMVKGTVGYIDPDYYTSNQLTFKSDIFSFGVVLLEIITGRKPIQHHEDPGQRYIGNWVKERFESDDIAGITDAALKGQYSEKAMRMVIALAINCISQHGADRPDTSEVVHELRTALKLEKQQRKKQSFDRSPHSMSEEDYLFSQPPSSSSHDSSRPSLGLGQGPAFPPAPARDEPGLGSGLSRAGRTR